MGPNNPWSPDWRPDVTGRRLATIRTMKRGALLAGALYVVVAVGVIVITDSPDRLGILAAAIGMPGVALLGAGLAPTTLGSRIDAAVAGVALAIGAPVAAVTSLVISGFIIGAVLGHDLTAIIVRTGVTIALGVAPAVALAATLWVLVLRRLGRDQLAAE